MRTCLFLVLAAASVTASSCKKDDPAAGPTGSNTASCFINGVRFVATGWDSGSILSNPVPPLSGGFSFDSVYVLELNGQFQGRHTTVLLFLRSQKPGTYELNRDTPYYPQGDPRYVLHHATFRQYDTRGEVSVTDARHTGRIVLTHADVARGLSAGTFEFTAVSTFDRTKTITVTHGYFDRKQ